MSSQHEESGKTPGGDAYLDPHPEPGAVRDDTPPSEVLEEQTKTQKRQQKRQEQQG